MQLDKILNENKLRVIRVIKESIHKVALVAKNNEKKVFVKITDDKKLFNNFINEIKAVNFINKIKPNKLKLIVPQGKTAKQERYILNIFEYVNIGGAVKQERWTTKKLP